MYTYEHLRGAFLRLKQENPVFYKENLRTIVALLSELTKWFDEFADKNNPKVEHLKERHHTEGIEEAVELFTKKYGNKYQEIVRKEATLHVITDIGRVPEKRDYNDEFFFDKLEANRQSNWF